MLTSEPPSRSSAGIGKIERLPLRLVWPHEALDFTTLLEHNTDVLSGALVMTIAIVEREAQLAAPSASGRGRTAPLATAAMAAGS